MSTERLEWLYIHIDLWKHDITFVLFMTCSRLFSIGFLKEFQALIPMHVGILGLVTLALGCGVVPGLVSMFSLLVIAIMQ